MLLFNLFEIDQFHDKENGIDTEFLSFFLCRDDYLKVGAQSYTLPQTIQLLSSLQSEEWKVLEYKLFSASPTGCKVTTRKELSAKHLPPQSKHVLWM